MSTSDLQLARSLNERLVAARTAERGAVHRLAVLLWEMADRALYRVLGYTSIHRYAAVALDLTGRVARDLLRIGRRLPELPALNAAMAAGELDWSKAREIVRVATPETEASWVDRARTESARVIEREVAAARMGEAAPTGTPAPDPKPARRRLVFELEAADADVLLQALEILRARTDLARHEVEDGALLAALARDVVHRAEPEEAPTGERYRVVLHQCSTCGHVEAPDGEVTDTIADEARCDAEVIDMRPGPDQGHAARVNAPVLRRKLLHRAGWKCEVPGCTNRLWLDVHHLRFRSRGGQNDVANLMVLCSSHHRALHEGNVAVSLGADGAVVVEHADGRRMKGRPRLVLGKAPPTCGAHEAGVRNDPRGS